MKAKGLDRSWGFSGFCLTVPSSFCSAYTVLKFVMMWTLVLLADFILEFRLEYLWPCWLFFGSVYTTFHCHGLVTLCFSLCNSALESIESILHYLLMAFSLFAGYLCRFCLCCLHPGHLLSHFCSFTLALLCCQHICLI